MAKLQQPAQMLPKEIYDDSTVLTHKPGASIHSSRVQGSHTADQGISIVFLNGLMTDKSTWLPVMAGVIKRCEAGGDGIPSMLAYDRYGQGLTEDRDPQDQGRETGHGHNVADAAVDLHHLIQQLMLDAGQRLLLVGNSIGCAIARLYAQKNPVAGVLLLDSIIANSNFNFWPDPDAPGFDKNQLPDDVGIDVLKAQRAKFRAIFDPANPNKEGLSRRDLADILPYSDRPALKGDSTGPWLTVVGHDFEAFADESLKVGYILC